MKLQLDFVPQPLSKLRWIPAGVMLFCAGALCAQRILAEVAFNTLSAKVAETEQLAAQQRKAYATATRRTPEQVQRDTAEHARQVLLLYPWRQVFMTLEQADSPDIAVLSFTQVQPGSGAELVVEAKDAAAVNQYITQLNGQSDSTNRWYIAALQLEAQALTIRATLRYLPQER